MCKLRFALVATAALFAASLSTGASAMTTMPANGLNAAMGTISDVEQVHWRHRGWHRGWHHGWRRHWHPRRHHGWHRW